MEAFFKNFFQKEESRKEEESDFSAFEANVLNKLFQILLRLDSIDELLIHQLNRQAKEQKQLTVKTRGRPKGAVTSDEAKKKRYANYKNVLKPRKEKAKVTA